MTDDHTDCPLAGYLTIICTGAFVFKFKDFFTAGVYFADRSLMLAESMLNNIPLARLYIRYSLTAGYGINSFGSKTIV